MICSIAPYQHHSSDSGPCRPDELASAVCPATSTMNAAFAYSAFPPAGINADKLMPQIADMEVINMSKQLLAIVHKAAAIKAAGGKIVMKRKVDWVRIENYLIKTVGFPIAPQALCHCSWCTKTTLGHTIQATDALCKSVQKYSWPHENRFLYKRKSKCKVCGQKLFFVNRSGGISCICGEKESGSFKVCHVDLIKTGLAVCPICGSGLESVGLEHGFAVPQYNCPICGYWCDVTPRSDEKSQ